MTKSKSFRKAILAAIGVYTLWGFSFMASKVGQEVATPFVLLAYRFDLAALLLSIPVIFGKAKVKLKGKNILPLLVLGMMEPCIYFIGEQYGLRLTNSAFSGVMIAIIPIVTLIMAAVFLKDRPSRLQWFFSILSIAGIIVITLEENSGGEVSLLGFACLLVAVLSGSAYGVISRGISDEFSVFERSYIMQLMGAAFFTVLAVIEHRSNLAGLITPLADKSFLLAVLYLAVGATVLGYTLFNYAVTNAPMANTIIFCNLTTVLSVVAGTLILKEPFTLLSIVAMAVVLIGIWGVQRFSPEQKDE